MDLREEQVEEFFATARERYRIKLRRENNPDSAEPFTEDPVMQKWFFCNVFREDDKVTVWIRENVRRVMEGRWGQITAMTACRVFNRIPSLRALYNCEAFWEWDPRKVREAMKNVRPVVGGAYVVRTTDGMNKLDGAIDVVNHVAKECANIETRWDAENCTLQKMWEQLRMFPCLGPFMAYEIVSDLRHTWVLRKAIDILSWANPGPGTCAGLSWVAALNLGAIPYGRKKAQREILSAMQTLLILSHADELWPKAWPAWEMREVEHWLCEYAKYVRAKHLGQRLKRHWGATR